MSKSIQTSKITQTNSKNRLLDFLLVITLVALLALTFYVIGEQFKNPIFVIILALLAIPTIQAMIYGAPFVPTPMGRVEQMVKLADLKPGNKVYDLGCGDGRFVYIAANKYGADAVGYELSPLIFALAKIRQFFWKSKAKIKFRNFKKCNLSDADVIFCYLLPESLNKIKTQLATQLKPGAKIVSYAFKVPEFELIHEEAKVPSENYAPILIYQKK